MLTKRVVVSLVAAALMVVVVSASGLPAYAEPVDGSNQVPNIDMFQCFNLCTTENYSGGGSDGTNACAWTCGYAPPDYSGPTDGNGNPIPPQPPPKGGK